MRSRVRVSLAVFAAAAAGLAACSTPGATSTTSSSSGATGGTINVALASDPGTIDPSLANTFDSRIVFQAFCQKLYDANNALQPVPQLAAALPKTSADGLTVTIPLRTGVKFNDGTPFNADAVKTTLERDLTLSGSARAKEIAAVKSVAAPNPTTVVITLSRPFSPLVAQLTDRAGLIMSPAALKKEGDKFGDNPVCVGPFKYSSRVSGTSVSFVKSSDYYDASKVKVDGITYKIISDPTTRAENLQSGDVQAAEQLDPTDIPRLKSDNSLKITPVSAPSYEGITINVSNAHGDTSPAGPVNTALSKSPQLRQAFEMALDRKTINKVVWNNAQSVDCLPLPLQMVYRPDNANCTPYDPAQAKQLVAASGVKMPVPVTMMIPADSGDDRMAQVIQSMENKVGFNMTIKPVDFTSALAAGKAGSFDTFLIGWSGRLDPDGDLSDIVTTDGSNDYSGLQNPQLDKDIQQAAAVSGVAARKAAYTTTLQLLGQLRPIVYLYHDTWFLGTSSKLTGVDYRADGIPRFTTASLNG
jgi:peptide/nickel transport system substrate-binding protein